MARGFQKLVQKFDKLRMPVPDSAVISYWYQSGRAYSEANRAWSNGLLQVLDAQRNRVLLSYLTEMETSTTLAPENVDEGISTTLASVRSGDFERLLQTQEGDAP
jgi:hypothetical protein